MTDRAIARLEPRDRSRLRELRATMDRLALEAPTSSEHVLEPLRELLDTERIVLYRLLADDDGFHLGLVEWAGYVMAAHQRDALASFIAGSPSSVHTWDPRRIPPRQRNVSYRVRQSTAEDAYALIPIVRSIYPRLGLSAHHDVRVLLCDGPTFLANVTAFRPDPFSAREARLVDALAPALRRWVAWRLRIAQHLAAGAALPAVLDAIATAAFLLDGSGRPLLANRAGHELLDRDRRTAREVLARCAHGGSTDFAVTRVSSPGLPAVVIAIERAPAAAADQRVNTLRREVGLTNREAEVLGLLAQGHTNRTVAEWLDCSERTVEIHVSRILAKVGADNRTALVARLWRS